MDKLYLKRLGLVNFKTYHEAELDFSQKINCFVGLNGVGKTNLFDSIYYLAFSKSYFSQQDAENISHGEDFFTIQGEFELSGRHEKLFCGVKRDQKKVFKRNDKAYERLADHIGLIPLVMVSPSDTNLIHDGSEERRKYMNNVISQYNRQYLEDVMHYNKALNHRNKLLKDFSRRGAFDHAALEVWDFSMADLGEKIHAARKDFIERLIPIFQHYYSFISEASEQVHLTYRSQLEKNNMITLIQSSLDRDRALQYSTVGIHRDDLLLGIKGFSIKQQGSQGQQKTFLVALKLAQYDFLKQISGIKPLMLLDDIFDKFDDKRVKRLVELVSDQSFGQIFITDKNPDNIKLVLSEVPVDSRLFTVELGKAIEKVD